MSLYPYQKTCVDFALAHNYTLNGCEMGLGKTRIALEAARLSGKRAGVFGPTFLRDVWRKEAEFIGVDVEYFPYSTLHKVRPGEVMGLDFWVAEECHMLKSPTTKRTHAFYSLLKEIRPEYFLGLSGTPIKNRIPDLWTLLAFCTANPRETNGLKLTGDLTHYKKFCRYFCNTTLERYGSARFEKFTGIKDEKIPELKALLRDKYIRFTVETVLKDLPELTEVDILVDSLTHDPDLAEAFKAYAEGRKFDATAKAKSAIITAPTTVEYVEGMRESGVGAVLIFSDHVESTEYIAKKIQGAVAVSGRTPAHLRQYYVDKFQGGEIETLVCTIGSMSTGHTLTAANHVVLNDISWVPSDNAQAIARIRRIGQTRPCFAHYIHKTPTSHHILKTLSEKTETIRRVLG